MTLLVVATPIGNLGDLSPRGLDALKRASVVLAEDTRRTRALLSHFGIAHKELRALHAHSSERDIEHALTLLREGQTVALVSDAGTPLVSDPGETLVQRAIAESIKIEPIPGPSAILAALVGSGLAGGPFTFFGFLARDGVARAEDLGRVCGCFHTAVIFEAPSRIQDTLVELADLDGDRQACVARELTKIHEEFVRGRLRDLANQAREWMGEIVLVLGPKQQSETVITDEALDLRISQELERGTHVKRIAELLAAWSGRPKREVYERVVARKSRG